MPSFNKPSKQKKPGLRIVIWLVVIILRYMWAKSFSLDANVKILPGNTVSKLFQPLSSRNKTRLKVYIKMHHIDLSKLEPGTYEFSGQYTRSQFVQSILAGPSNKYIKITVLEGRSIYDIDASLTKKWLINQGEYITLVTDPTIISKYQAKYPYLSNLNTPLSTLEGFLYPDTYNVDAGNNIVDQLVYLQLETFKKRVWTAYTSQITPVGTQRYPDMILASIVEKEEKNNVNKPTVAGIFFKRLQIWMKLDADITLCYGLHQPYESCTPSVIARNIADENNVYNTRKKGWLPPQPISNPTVESILAVLNPQKSDFLYYLHDMKWIIHYGSTLDEHNANKVKYLQ